MNAAASQSWPWLALAGLGFFHGINPAMGWLFAVALGMQRQSRKAVLLSWIPIALGHAAAVAAVLAAVLLLGLVLSHAALSRLAAGVLIGWAIWHAVRGHRQRVRFGMQTGLIGLALWSFLMASAHGAGLMLVPALLPMCLSGPTGSEAIASGSIAIAAAGFALHTTVLLVTIAAVSTIVYEWVGLAFLRSGWINLDLVWIAALGVSGAALLLLA